LLGSSLLYQMRHSCSAVSCGTSPSFWTNTPRRSARGWNTCWLKRVYQHWFVISLHFQVR
jgi:hypothetical protein